MPERPAHLWLTVFFTASLTRRGASEGRPGLAVTGGRPIVAPSMAALVKHIKLGLFWRLSIVYLLLLLTVLVGIDI